MHINKTCEASGDEHSAVDHGWKVFDDPSTPAHTNVKEKGDDGSFYNFHTKYSCIVWLPNLIVLL